MSDSSTDARLRYFEARAELQRRAAELALEIAQKGDDSRLLEAFFIYLQPFQMTVHRLQEIRETPEELALAAEVLRGGDLMIFDGIPENRHPETVAIGRLGSNAWIGTGVLISPEAVLTAAHVVEDRTKEELIVVFGPDAWNSTKTSKVTDLALCDHYPEEKGHDLAILELPEGKGAGIAPAKMAPAGQLQAHRPWRFIGYGRSQQHGGSGIKRRAPVADPQIGDWEIVATLKAFDSCPGDSGGPLFVEIEGHPHLAGITSGGVLGSGNVCGAFGEAHWVRVDKNLTWIQSKVPEFGTPAPA